MFGGVYWDVLDTLLEDVERIEVIRGPGGAMWGANAVNGVINVITKKASETQGGLTYSGVGSEQRGMGGLRYGFALGDGAHLRVYGKYADHDGQVDRAGAETHDAWDMLRGGFRLDWERTEDTLLTVLGDAYEGTVRSELLLPVFTPPFAPRAVDQETDVSGANLLARWRKKGEDGSGTTVQAWLDVYDRDDPDLVRERRGTADLELQHSFPRWGSHAVMVGASYRVTTDRVDGTAPLDVSRRQRTDGIVGMFVHDDLTLVPDRLTASAGVKLEYNEYSHLGYQPDVRLMFRPGRRHSVWAAASGALRSPTRADEDLTMDVAAFAGPGGLPMVVHLDGNRTLDAERLWAFEVGYRFQGSERLSLDMSVFHNTYDDLIAFQAGTPFVDPDGPRFVLPVRFVNGQDAEATGFELSGNWVALDHLRLSPTYTLLDLQIEDRAAGLGPSGRAAEGSSPTNQFGLRAAWTPLRDWEVGAAANYVDHLPGRGIPSYVRLDARIEWRVREHLHLELVMQNLLDDRHPEFTSDLYSQPTEIERGLFFRLSARF
jgi:iron complex outermembrane receptor protein